MLEPASAHEACCGPVVPGTVHSWAFCSIREDDAQQAAEEIVTAPQEIVTTRGAGRVGIGSGHERCVAQSLRQHL